ncbi:hypothetical protein KR009_002617, partial [Drosophila setifemur]
AENLKAQEEVNSLKGLGQHLENLLKLASIELGDFSDDDMALIDKCAQLYTCLHIHDFDLNYLRDLYFSRKRDHIENRQTMVQQKTQLRRVKEAIDEAAKDVAGLERFKSTAEKRLIPESVVQQRNKQICATKQGLMDRQKAFAMPKEFSIEDIMEKVESLERH